MTGVGAQSAITPDAPTIREAISRFLQHIQHTQSVATTASYNQALTVFTRFLATHTSLNLASALLSQISLDIFHDFLLFLQDTYSPETEHAYFRAVTALIINSSTKMQILSPQIITQLNEMTHQIRRKKHKQEPEIPFAIIARIRSYAGNIPLPEPDPEALIQRERLRLLRDKALIFTIIDTGLKPSEVTALRLQDIDYDSPAITFQRISLPLEQTTIRAIQGYLRERESLDQQQTDLPRQSLALFARHDKRASSRLLPISRWTVGNIITYWTRLSTESSETEPQQVTPSLLRHHFVVSTLATTDDLQLTQQRARHKDKGTTRHYLRQRNKPAIK